MSETKNINVGYEIPECNLAEFETRIAKLNKRAKKLGVPAIVTTVTPGEVRYEVKQPQANAHLTGNLYEKHWMTAESFARNQLSLLPSEKTGRVMMWYNVEVTGEAPSFADWTFIATLEPINADGESLNLLQCVPGEVCPPKYRNIVGKCDHCNMHRQRKQTFVVRHTTGEHKCVGRQCVKDFLNGHKDPNQLAAWAEMLCEMGSLGDSASDEGWLGGRGTESGWDLENFLGWTASSIASRGWCSKKYAYEIDNMSKATVNHVLHLLTPPWAGAPDEEKRLWAADVAKHEPTDKNKATAVAAIEWARAITEDELNANNYLANLNAVARAGYVPRKTTGLAASMVSAYQRAHEMEVKKLERATRKPSNHVGVVCKRMTMTVTCKRIISTEGNYGLTGIHKMTDAEGNELTWFASGSTTWLKEGGTYDVKATVKKHDEYKGTKCTVVNRLAIVKEHVDSTESTENDTAVESGNHVAIM